MEDLFSLQSAGRAMDGSLFVSFRLYLYIFESLLLFLPTLFCAFIFLNLKMTTMLRYYTCSQLKNLFWVCCVCVFFKS